MNGKDISHFDETYFSVSLQNIFVDQSAYNAAAYLQNTTDLTYLTK